jgi:hypothetical protein
MRGPKVGTGTSSGQGGRGCGRLGAIHPGYGAAPACGKPTLLSRTGRGHDRTVRQARRNARSARGDLSVPAIDHDQRGGAGHPSICDRDQSALLLRVPHRKERG